MTAWTSRLQASPGLGAVAGSADTHGVDVPARSAVTPRRAVLHLHVLIALALACLALGLALHQGLGSPSRPAVSSGAAPHATSRAGLLSLPAAAQGSVSAALGSDQAAYRIEGLVARNPAQRLSARFGRSGVAITTGSARFSISLKAFGRGSAPALAPVPPVSPAGGADRVTYARGSLREWWANGPLGLEQGFDIARRPAGAGALTLALEVSTGAPLRLDHGTLLLPGGLRYAGVRATDAGGRRVPAWLQLRDGRVLVRVDDRGARYPLRVDPYVQQSAELTASDASEEGALGYSVAVAGDTAVVGAPHEHYPQPVGPSTNTNPGAVYVFELGAGGWTQTAKLTAPDGPANGLGWSVAISENGETIVAGAPGPPSVSNPCGSKEGNLDKGQAYVYMKPGGGWKETSNPTATLTASDACVGDGFGWSVGISGSTIVAGAPWAPTVGSAPAPEEGEAYEYTMPSGGWKTKIQTAELTANNPSGADVHNGWSVAISGETIVTGDPEQGVGGQGDAGAAYVFVKPKASEWTNAPQTAELTASDRNPGNDRLGTSVAISGNTIVAGAPNHSTGSGGAEFEAGAAYVFVKPKASEWTNAPQTAELAASDGAGAFGSSVAVSGTTIVAGAPSYQACAHSGQGAAYAFSEPAGGWTNMTEPAEFTSSDGSTVDALGSSVAVSGSTIFAGAPRHLATGGPNREAGAAYVFNNGEGPTLNCEGSSGTGETVPITTGSSATTGSQTTTGSATSTTVSPVLPSAQVGSISGGNGTLMATLSCPAGGAACAAVSLQATAKESLKGGKLTAVTASGKKKPARTTTKQVVVAGGAVTLSAGATQTLTLKLNATGQALLSKFGKLPAIVTVSAGGRTIDTVTVTVQKAKPKKKKKK
jgi:FG-GAP repeat